MPDLDQPDAPPETVIPQGSSVLDTLRAKRQEMAMDRLGEQMASFLQEQSEMMSRVVSASVAPVESAQATARELRELLEEGHRRQAEMLERMETLAKAITCICFSMSLFSISCMEATGVLLISFLR